jgi:hypothetical protein
MKNLIALLCCTFIVLSASAQKKELISDKTEILAAASAAFDASLQPGSAVYEAIVKEGLKGRYVMEVSFRDKGDISSVFVVSAEDADIPSQNRFKDLIHGCKMPFKMPKGRQYRLEHTFDLNAIQR